MANLPQPLIFLHAWQNREKKVLTIDSGSSGNTTSGLGVDKNEVEDTLYELLVGQSDVEKTIVKDVVEKCRFDTIKCKSVWRRD